PKPTIVPVVAAVALVRPTTPRATTAAAVAVTLTYRRSVLLRPGFTGLPFGSAVGVRQGRRQTWFVPPKQSQICNRVPSAALAPVASRHLLACGLRSVPLPCACQTCAPVPLQV